MNRAIRVDSLPAPKFRYSPALAAGRFVKTAGLIGIDKQSGELVPGGVASQVDCILENVRALMDANGLRSADMISATIYTTEFDSFPAINAAWERFFPADGPLPTRTSIGVSALPLKAAVEIEFTFYRFGCDGSQRDECRNCGKCGV